MERCRILGLIAGALLLSGVGVTGQEPLSESMLAQRAMVLAAEAVPVLGTSGVLVVGVVWNEDGTPVAHPVLQIRDLQDGRVVARTIGSGLGEFRFDRLDGGSYLIELIDHDDGVLAVGQPLFLLAGETVGTYIRLSTQGGPVDARLAAAGSELFAGSAPDVVQTAAHARVTTLGGGSAASNER